MKKYFLYSALVALALVGCDYNEDNFEGFDDLASRQMLRKVHSNLRIGHL